MAVMCDAYGGACVVTVVGDLTDEDAVALGDAVRDALQHGAQADIVVDLRGCDFMDDRGLEAIVAARQLCEAKGGHLELANVGLDCRTILRAGALTWR